MVQRKIVYEGLCCCKAAEYLYVNARRTDSMPFLAMAMVRNGGCRKALGKYRETEKEQFLSAYQRTVYAYSCFLENFILEEREDVRIVLGMLQLVREEAPREKRYHELIEILSEGFRAEKRLIGKQTKVNGRFLEKVMEQKLPVNALIPEMMVQLVLAEELGVAIERDPAFYRVMRRMEEHLKGWIQEETWKATEQGKSFYHKLCKEHPNPENWFAGSWRIEYANELNDVIMIMNQFHLKEQILNKLSLEKEEAEILCSLDRNMDWNVYRSKLLIATLCKYIHEIQVEYEEKYAEERKWSEREKVLTQKAELLEWKNRQLNKELWAMHNLLQELEEKPQGDGSIENRIDQTLCRRSSKKDRVYLFQ